MSFRTIVLVAGAMVVGGLVVGVGTGAIDVPADLTNALSDGSGTGNGAGAAVGTTTVPEAGASQIDENTVAYHGDFLQDKFENFLKGNIRQENNRLSRRSDLDAIAQDVARRMARDTSTSGGLEGVGDRAEDAGCFSPQIDRVSIDIEDQPNSENVFSDRIASRLSVPNSASQVGIGSRIGSDGRLYVGVLYC